MASMRSCSTSLILIAAAFLMMLFISNHQQVAAEDASVSMMRGRNMKSIDCGSACAYRCSKASRAKLCLKDCKICCQKCQCVPPGTAGNREACPCYANIKNSKGTGKCP